MVLIKTIIDMILHLDKHLNAIIQSFGGLTYVLLFLIVFAETGLVVTPFLPGDSLLFAVGTFAAVGSLNVALSFVILSAAAILGDSVNYSIGKFLGKKAIEHPSRIIKKEYIDKTKRFYEKYGAKTIVLARFVPIVRTFAPFVAGVGKMNYLKFLTYNITGGILWVGIFVFGGYLFGNIPIVKENFSVVIIIIIVLSFTPVFIEFYRHNKHKKSK